MRRILREISIVYRREKQQFWKDKNFWDDHRSSQALFCWTMHWFCFPLCPQNFFIGAGTHKRVLHHACFTHHHVCMGGIHTGEGGNQKHILDSLRSNMLCMAVQSPKLRSGTSHINITYCVHCTVCILYTVQIEIFTRPLIELYWVSVLLPQQNVLVFLAGLQKALALRKWLTIKTKTGSRFIHPAGQVEFKWRVKELWGGNRSFFFSHAVECSAKRVARAVSKQHVFVYPPFLYLISKQTSSDIEWQTALPNWWMCTLQLPWQKVLSPRLIPVVKKSSALYQHKFFCLWLLAAMLALLN